MFGMWLAYDISGAHMNPAVSISLSLFRKFPGRLCVIYVFVQLIAAIVAGALAFGIYKDTIRHINPTMTNTAKTFFSSPQEWVSMGTACFDQVVGSAIMMIAVCALSDLRNREHGINIVAWAIVHKFEVCLGRGEEVWETGWWLFGPWLSTVGGSIIGCIVYDIFVFVGAESPINWHVPDYIKKRARRMTRTETEK
ncbi:aquaporin-like protein [Hypoxylon fragiforme]|uniref:aquaporin-like protein n=1 Tax=Hypoxylon fragiforme TaxID=63214 RepID=UPI0020C6479B|nr:aquaporin-like protein [Hypoxylon fragiforme]KAI2603873.1 aquaporin-like protein [Hypoxylon fragiforme]